VAITLSPALLVLVVALALFRKPMPQRLTPEIDSRQIPDEFLPREKPNLQHTYLVILFFSMALLDLQS
jgi:hypothetical protein